MKKLLALLYAVILILSTSACGTSENIRDDGNPVELVTNYTQPVVASEPISAQPVIEETVIFDSNGIKATVKGFEQGFMGPCFNILVENETTQNIAFAGSDFVINESVSLLGNMYIDVAAGKKANGQLELFQSYMDEAGIEHIRKIRSLNAYIFNTETFETICSLSFQIDADSNESEIENIDVSGSVLYEKEGFTIIAKGFGDNGFSKTAHYLVLNRSGKDVLSQVRNTSVNGFMINAGNSDYIADGTARFCSIDYLYSYLEENAIDDIEETAFTIVFVDPVSFEALYQTEELLITN